MALHARHLEWLTGRGLEPSVVERFGLETHQHSGKNWLRVPFVENGLIVNHKWRLTSEKIHRMDEGAPMVLFNADCLKSPEVIEGRAPVIITEGEWDALIAIQCGFEFTVSVPNGAPPEPTADVNSARRYEWVDRHAEALGRVRSFIIASDDDQAGWNLRSDLVALLGAERCKFLDYPFPSKDLNEIFQDYGRDRVQSVINSARDFPVKGLYTPADFPERGEIREYSVGIPEISEYISLVPGTLTVVTGYANSGKSTLVNQVIGNALRNHFPVCVASFETDVKPILINGLRMSMIGCAKHDLEKMDTQDVDKIIRDRLKIISQQVDEELEMDVEELLGLAKLAVDRHGIKLLVIDPWNEIEHRRRQGENETEYIGRSLRAIKLFAKRNDVAVWIVVHPAKPHPTFKGAPGLYEASGSAHWANKADYGLTYYRPKFDENHAKIIINKVRMGLPGRRAEVEVMYDFRTSRFSTYEN